MEGIAGAILRHPSLLKGRSNGGRKSTRTMEEGRKGLEQVDGEE
jgi:hypothetical protein